MKNCRLIWGVFLMLSLSSVFGQQDAQYTQYMYNMNVLNPAYAGSRGNLSIGLLGRAQWVGIEGAPQTITLSLNSPVGKNIGLGLSAISDTYGPVKEQSLYADFSYTIKTSEIGRLAFGIKAGASFLDVNLLSLNPNDPEFSNTLSNNVNEVYPNIGAGAYYYTDRFYLGLSIPNLIDSNHLKESSGIVSTASEEMHYFLTSGYVFELSDEIKLKPSIMFKGAFGAPVSVDLSANMLMYDKFELGLSYRFDDSLSTMVGFQITPGIRAGYAYDYTISNLGNYNSGSHEIILLFDILNNKLKSPRFF
ncbi:MAG: type IX secretion system PorP/SprF family membrane protein [bacterium]|jgi:type IX secretion system PorP/SprF family membrane protein